jgi:hypothetical protein
MRGLVLPAVAAALLSASAAAQVSQPAPGTTREQAEAAAERMMMQMGKTVGVDPEALRNALPEERQLMLRDAGKAMAERIRETAAHNFGVTPEEMKTKTPDELRARMAVRMSPPAAEPVPPPPPLPPARGFRARRALERRVKPGADCGGPLQTGVR